MNVVRNTLMQLSTLVISAVDKENLLDIVGSGVLFNNTVSIVAPYILVQISHVDDSYQIALTTGKYYRQLLVSENYDTKRIIEFINNP